jgi:tetratricopeptide (TPR) repeat protein
MARYVALRLLFRALSPSMSEHPIIPSLFLISLFAAGCTQSFAGSAPSQARANAGSDAEPQRVAAATTAQSELRFSSSPEAAEFLRVGLFSLPLVPLGPSSPAVNRAFAQALVAYEAAVAESGARDSVAPLLEFVERYPDSAWLAVLQVNLGVIYRQTGHFSLALTSWQRAWQLSRDATDAHGRAVGDAAVGQLSQLLAYLGRKQELEQLLSEIQERPVQGTAAELLNESSRGLADMRTTPELAFKCGPFALSRILQYEKPAPPADKLELLQRAHSTPQGLSLRAVQALSVQAGLHFQMAFRTPGARTTRPSSTKPTAAIASRTRPSEKTFASAHKLWTRRPAATS